MKHLFILLTVITIATMTKAKAQTFDLKRLASYETTLDDVMEIIDKKLVKEKLKEVEDDFFNTFDTTNMAVWH